MPVRTSWSDRRTKASPPTILASAFNAFARSSQVAPPSADPRLREVPADVPLQRPQAAVVVVLLHQVVMQRGEVAAPAVPADPVDRKSTRLNSSHVSES